jgi:hypothetical protein
MRSEQSNPLSSTAIVLEHLREEWDGHDREYKPKTQQPEPGAKEDGLGLDVLCAFPAAGVARHPIRFVQDPVGDEGNSRDRGGARREQTLCPASLRAATNRHENEDENNAHDDQGRQSFGHLVFPRSAFANVTRGRLTSGHRMAPVHSQLVPLRIRLSEISPLVVVTMAMTSQPLVPG